MIYEITVEDFFSAAHKLRDYEGECERLHGHNWKVEVSLTSQKLNKQEIVIDFRELKRLIKDILGELDHQYLNDLPYFKKDNPTTENIAGLIYKKLQQRIEEGGIEIKKVRVWESDNASISITE
ncbi:MAG: 6-carboxy-5,6,7,8-tetrahydropterin synthase [Syntrophomonadaceae bacterium]|nr:6-carboxy-5,6,7,8-tetrahydropterin synthase [Bacillota bacterium]MBT9138712.1 6-carboxy-5,6,7,8-tetrahydropterin synthase [Bacillota bacterium]MBT9146319.1 6-carboxy-5,6,7,8-tetrahydropterin synthase [Bacillota bacterium]